MRKLKSEFSAYLAQMQEKDPEVAAEVKDKVVMTESAGRGGPPIIAETIVLTVGRPVLDIKGGTTVVEISEVESQVWKGRLNGAVAKIKPNIPAVGRIEL